MDRYWVDSFIGGDIYTLGSVQEYELTDPPGPDSYFNLAEFGLKAIGDDFIAPQLKLACLMQNPETDRKTPAILNGVQTVDSSIYKKMLDVREGSMLTPGADEMLLPDTLAYRLGVGVDDHVVVFSWTKDGYPNAERMRVCGIFDWKSSAPASSGGAYFSYANIDSVQLLTDVPEGTVSEIIVSGSSSIEKTLQAIGGILLRHSALDTVPFCRLMSIAFSILRIVLYSMVCLIMFSVIYNNFSVILYQSRWEIALYRSFGATKRMIYTVVVMPINAIFFLSIVLSFIICQIMIAGFNFLEIRSINTATEIMLSGQSLVMRSQFGDMMLIVILSAIVFAASTVPPFLMTIGQGPVSRLWRQ